jgi:hypothetical protein
MWRIVRIVVLLLTLFIVAAQAWLDRHSTTSWRHTVYVGAFPINADGSEVSAQYVARFAQRQLDEVAGFLKVQSHHYGVGVDEPVSLLLYRTPALLPPTLEPGAGVPARILWSLKLRYYRHRVLAATGRAPPQIALFLLYHDPALAQSLPHSAGLQRGLTAVVHVFASRSQEAQNRIVITHELLHTFGATDKYDLASGLPLYPQGYVEPQRIPRYPQQLAEIMAGQTPLTASDSRLPDSLDDERVGPITAQEIGWAGR